MVFEHECFFFQHLPSSLENSYEYIIVFYHHQPHMEYIVQCTTFMIHISQLTKKQYQQKSSNASTQTIKYTLRLFRFIFPDGPVAAPYNAWCAFFCLGLITTTILVNILVKNCSIFAVLKCSRGHHLKTLANIMSSYE